MTSTTCAREVGFFRSPERTNFAVPSVIVGIIEKPAPRSAASGVAIGMLGFAGAYRSAITGEFVFPSNLRVYQKGITSLIRSALSKAAGNEVFIE